MGRPSNSKSQIDLERRRLSEIALRLFHRDGYEAVSLRKLAAEAGVSHNQPYSYFSSKEELFAHLRSDLVTQFSDFILRPIPNIPNSIAKIRIVLERFAEFVIAHPDDYQLMFSMNQPDPRKYPELFESREQLMEAMKRIFQQAIDEGLLRGDATLHAHIAWGTMHGILSLHASNQLVHGRELLSLVVPAIQQLFGSEQGDPDQSLRKSKRKK